MRHTYELSRAVLNELVCKVKNYELSASLSSTPSPSGATDTVVSEEAVAVTVDFLNMSLMMILGFLAGTFVAFCFLLVLQFATRKFESANAFVNAIRVPLHGGASFLGAWLALRLFVENVPTHWQSNAEHIFIICEIIVVTWLVTRIIGAVKTTILRKTQKAGKSRFRKIQTQLQILHRVIIVVVWLIGVSFVLMTFPQARNVGASLIASAGLISVIAGVAAQSTLGNIFAGLQLAFSDSIRVGDVVSWDGNTCVVEEITLTYVVLSVWDGRRLLVPSSAMTKTTFENWTRRSSEILMYVDFRMSWMAPLDRVRAQLKKILEATDLWDGKVGVLQVRNADEEYLHVSALVSAPNTTIMSDLRNYVRESMVVWMQKECLQAIPADVSAALAHQPQSYKEEMDNLPEHIIQPSHLTHKTNEYHDDEHSLPHRVSVLERVAHEAREAAQAGNVDGPITMIRPGHESSIFSGSLEAEIRALAFEKGGQEAIREREEAYMEAHKEKNVKNTDQCEDE